jgi:hypothetical protein
MRVQRQGLRKHLGVKDRRALSAVAIARHDIQILRAGLDGHTGGLQVVPFIPGRQQYLSYRDAVLVKPQHAALAVDRHIEVTVAIGAHGVRSRTDEIVRRRRPDRCNLGRIRQHDPVQEVSGEFGDPRFLPVSGLSAIPFAIARCGSTGVIVLKSGDT